MCLYSGRWWLDLSRSLRCGRFLLPLWTTRGPRCMLFEPSWTRGVRRGAFSTSWSGRGRVRRRDAGGRWRTSWPLRCCGSSTVSIRIALRLVLRVIPEVGVDFRRSQSLSLFGLCSTVDVAGLLAIADPLFIFHLFCLCFTHLVSIPQLHVHYLTLCFPHGFCACLFIVSSVRCLWAWCYFMYFDILTKVPFVTHLCCPAPDSSAPATPRSLQHLFTEIPLYL